MLLSKELKKNRLEENILEKVTADIYKFLGPDGTMKMA
jgi:hypothetical protein